MPKLFFIIPALNESQNIPALFTTLKTLAANHEIHCVVVDDGSTDDTSAVAQNWQNQLSIEIIRHQTNQGVPQTFFDGLVAAAAQAENDDVIFIVEGDNTSDLALVPSMVAKITAGADVVVASRYVRGGAYKNFPWHRTAGSKIINTFLYLFFHVDGVTDYTIFYRAYRAGIIQSALKEFGRSIFTTHSFAANLELLLAAKKYTKNFQEVPLVYDYGLKKGKSKMRLFRTLAEYGQLLIK